MPLNLAVGTSDFKEMIDNHYYFVDKSLFIKSILEDSAEVILLPRPRRFGKTLNLSMLYYFLEGFLEKSHQHLFDHLAIHQKDDFCSQHQNKYPVIFLTFKDIKEDNFEDAFQAIKSLLSNLYEKYYDFLFDGLSKRNQYLFESIMMEKATRSHVKYALMYLSEWLKSKTKQQTVILIDEYDTPITESYLNGYYPKLINLMRGIFGAALKGNNAVKKGVITGITRVAKESIFSDINNFTTYSLFNKTFPQYFGFTEEDVQQLLRDDKHLEQHAKIKNWYNGYQFGETVLYNPWSIINCIKYQYEFEPYWTNTSSNALIRELLAHAKAPIKAAFSELLQGKTVSQKIDEYITFSDSEYKLAEETLWGLLLSAGYLKVVTPPKEGSKVCEIAIPNQEIKLLYHDMVEYWFGTHSHNDLYQHFVKSLAAGDIETFSIALNTYLRQTGSYFDFAVYHQEQVFHTFILGLVVGLQEDYIIHSNKESGLGRFDVLLQPKHCSEQGIILEFKVTDDPKKMQETAKVALAQIKDKHYITFLEQQGVQSALLLGVAFCGSHALIFHEELSL